MMKQVKMNVCVSLAMFLALGTVLLGAQDTASLTRAQWLKKIGASVTNVDVLRETFAQVAPEDRVEFTQRVLKAVTRMPVNPDEKAAVFVRTAVACIAGVTGEAKYNVIAEVFAGVPVEYLPVVTEELAKRFDQEYNHLSDEAYEKIACAAVKVAVERNAKTDAPSVRNTFVILAFLRGAKSPQLQEKLLALLPDDRMRKLVASWLPAALKDRKYDALLAAADVDAAAVSYDRMLHLVGVGALDQLLYDLGTGIPLSSVTGSGVFALPSSRFTQPIDFGINRVPTATGYQNQGTDIRKGSRDGSGDSGEKCPCAPPTFTPWKAY